MKNEFCKLAVIGGGPIGLFTAIRLAELGHEIDLFEKGSWPRDKVCGQGILPSGRKLLKDAGVNFKENEEAYEFHSIEYIDGELKLKGTLPSPAIGVKRKILSERLYRRALEFSNIKLLESQEVKVSKDSSVEVNGKKKEYEYIFACDGLNSSVRKQLGLELTRKKPHRFGARLHFNQTPWCDSVQVFWSRGVEAYVTPVSANCIEVAFLWFEDRVAKGANIYKRLIHFFPELDKKLDDSLRTNDFKAYGPFRTVSKKLYYKNIFFIGDAYYFLDGITGEGISLGLKSADIITKNFKHLGFKQSLKIKVIYLNYKLWVSFALFLSHYPSFRKLLLKMLGPSNKLFNLILRLNDIGAPR